jgi:hypothetical protein
MGKVAQPLQRRENEPVIYPDGFDKFTGGELQRILEQKGIKTLVVTGCGEQRGGSLYGDGCGASPSR